MLTDVLGTLPLLTNSPCCSCSFSADMRGFSPALQTKACCHPSNLGGHLKKAQPSGNPFVELAVVAELESSHHRNSHHHVTARSCAFALSLSRGPDWCC